MLCAGAFVDPVLAQSLVDSLDELSATARRYPNGLQTMREEAEAEAARRKAEGATSGSGSMGAVNPKHLARQLRLIDAIRNGDFGPSIEDAIVKYRGDASPETSNFGPKEYWPSTGAFRTLFHQAGKQLGPDAAKLLDQVPDDDLRLFASIELAAALAGVPEPPIRTRGQRYPPGSSASRRGRIVASSSGRQQGEGTSGSTMRSPDGRLIRFPKCSFQPSTDTRWGCKCGHSWNMFWTSGLCPACHFQWEVTRCPRCHEISEHRAWYVAER